MKKSDKFYDDFTKERAILGEKKINSMLQLIQGDITDAANWENGIIDTIVNAAQEQAMSVYGFLRSGNSQAVCQYMPCAPCVLIQ